MTELTPRKRAQRVAALTAFMHERAMKKLLQLGSKPNKYEPHQGKREKARRLRRMGVADVTAQE